MAAPKLDNYLRMYRKRSGLTQREVAFLLGCQNGAQVSRYEKRRRVPPLRTALACEVAFGIPVAVLFAGIREAVAKNVEGRLAKVETQLRAKAANGCQDRMTAQKLQWLADRRGPASDDQAATA